MRRRGIGRALVQAVRRPGMMLQMRESNVGARALYAELGSHEIKPCRYRDGEAGVVWEQSAPVAPAA